MKLKAIVYGKKNCSLCENRKDNLKRFPAIYKKKTGKEMEIEMVYHDIKTVDGLVAFCKESRSTSEIPIVVLEDLKGRTLKIWNGPREAVSTRQLMELCVKD